VTADPLFSAHSSRIAELALKSRLPTIFWTREHAEAGGLMSYGQNNAEHYYRAANYVDRLFKGARPGDLPVELAARIELVLNRRTARALRLELPSDLIVRADSVID
jgi:putative ABC transport system substrate-binding protein